MVYPRKAEGGWFQENVNGEETSSVQPICLQFLTRTGNNGKDGKGPKKKAGETFAEWGGRRKSLTGGICRVLGEPTIAEYAPKVTLGRVRT